jgi:hypothetical protein
MTSAAFVEALRVGVPEVAAVIDEHLDDNEGELLIHLLMADLERFCVSAFAAGAAEGSRRCLDAVAVALATGDDHLRNAVEVSFVEHAWDERREFLATWPEPLLTEWREQQASS